MVKITVFQNSKQEFIGFNCLGHAGYADGDDIVCAGVSALVINCINSIEDLTDQLFICDSDPEDGMISFRVDGKMEPDAQLLLKSLALGLEGMESNYEEYIDLIFEEV